MKNSLLYQAFGFRNHECFSISYEDKSVILNIQTRADKLRCSYCKSKFVIRSGCKERIFRSVLVGRKPVLFRAKVQRLKCKCCGLVRQENIPFTTGKSTYTHQLSNLVIELSRIGTIKDVANFLHLSWDTVKDIQKKYLKRHFANPNLKDVRIIGIDEFAIAKGHVYKTIVVDLETGKVVYIADGKGIASLDEFWKKATKHGANIQAVATDFSRAFISSVMKNSPDSVLVFDHFHVVKLMNDTIDQIRRDTYREEVDLNKRKVLKGTRWLLLQKGEDIFDEKHKTRLDNALKLNEPLAKAYYLKESLSEIWKQTSKAKAEVVLDDWVKLARGSGIQKLNKFANTLLAHKFGILAWYDYRISTGKVEGINNKIKTMKRQAYGYRDQEFFELKILSLHEKNYALIG